MRKLWTLRNTPLNNSVNRYWAGSPQPASHARPALCLPAGEKLRSKCKHKPPGASSCSRGGRGAAGSQAGWSRPAGLSILQQGTATAGAMVLAGATLLPRLKAVTRSRRRPLPRL